MIMPTSWTVAAWIIAARLLSLPFCSALLVEQPQPEIHSDVQQLIAVADFHSVHLSWKVPTGNADALRPQPRTFLVKHCEVVMWGKDKCMSRVLNATAEAVDEKTSNDLADMDVGGHVTTYRTTVEGLRLATNYSFEVHPLMDADVVGEAGRRGLSVLHQEPTPVVNARSLDVHAGHNDLVVTTKAFSAHPRTCLGDRTEVDIETGPNFTGHVSVEGAYDRRCTWLGDERDSSSVHTFVIDHQLCGGVLKEGRIETIVIVSESRTIITHTARRFMVVCNLVPETYTIKASINVPSNQDPSKDSNQPSNELAPGNDVDSELSYEEILPLGRLPSNNRRISSQHTAELRQMAQLLEGNRNDSTAAHLILMVVLVVAVSVGTVATAWWFIAQRSRAGHFDLAEAEYDERLSTCRNVVVVPGKTSNDDDDHRGHDVSAIGGVDRQEDQGLEHHPFDWRARGRSSFGSTSGSRMQLGKPDRSIHLDQCSPDDQPSCAATTLVLAPSITAAFQSTGDSCC